MNEFVITLLLGGCFLVLFAVGELLYRHFALRAELTRKIVHIGTGLITLGFPLLLKNHWMVFLLALAFILLLLLSLKYRFLPSINAINRQSVGSLVYPIAVYISFLAFVYFDRQLLFFYLPVLILAISDPIAEWVGKCQNWKPFEIIRSKKTLSGSLGFFVSTFIIALICLFNLQQNVPATSNIFQCLIIASVATVAEAFAGRGLDNLSIPMSVLLVLWFFQ